MKIKEFLEKFEESEKERCDEYHRPPAFMESDEFDLYNYIRNDFEEGGRWHNYRTYTYALEDGFLSVSFKEGATESQENDWLYATAYQVWPVEITTTVFVTQKPDEK